MKIDKVSILVLITLIFVGLNNLFSQPIDNSIATFYNSSQYSGEGYPIWTDDIKWNNVIDMSTYTNGANDFAKFESARDLLYSQGGGVLYYPAGIYDFKDHPTDPNGGRGLHLKKGVVIRGAEPSTNKWAIKNRANTTDDSGLSDLQTVFLFPTWDKKTSPMGEFTVQAGNGLVPRTWNQIGLMPDKANGEHLRDVNYVGVAWVKFKFATVYFGDDFAWDEVSTTYATAGAWKSNSAKTTNEYGQNWADRIPDGTHPFDPFTGSAPNGYVRNGSKCRFIFGCRFENAVVTDDIWKHGGDAATANYGYFGSRFIGRIVMGGEHIFVANTIVPKSTESFYYDMKLKLISKSVVLKTVCFDYSRSIGIDINKSLSSQRGNLCLFTGADKGSYYLNDVIVQDNYVWQHGNKGYELSGKWMVVRRNVREGKPLIGNNTEQNPTSDDVYGFGLSFNGGKGWFNTLSGGDEAGGASDNMSRGMDMSGWNLWVDNNYINGQGSWPGNDGEGILWQVNGANNHAFSAAVTNNEQGPSRRCAFVSTSYIAPWGTHIMGMLQGWNKVFKVGTWGPGIYRFEDFSVVGNDNLDIAKSLTGVYKDVMYDTDCSGSANGIPTNLSVVKDVDNKCNIVSWTDNSTNESSFRVERKEVAGATWSLLAYRPRNATGANNGPQNPDGWQVITTGICANQYLDLNPQQWYDYTAINGKNYEYRVVAIGCDQNDYSAATVPQYPTKVDLVNDIVNGLLIYPVPVKDILHVRLENKFEGKLTIEIVDLQGKTVLSKNNNKYSDVLNETLNLNTLNKGVYLCKMKGNGLSIVSRILVE